ncbi:MAG: hypothetical protein NZ651_05210 [Candidatus Bipolaricaulota bacterium]|nr:hypothetical protein [Candidatus Bipolaricaulota bacterium]MDW8127151.1 hypothetical protein [Candidatus Bipolaricaulota bacterium]
MPILIAEPQPQARTPEEELRQLEEEVLRRGMSPAELAQIQALGRCPAQIQHRIALLKSWLAQR